MRTVFEINDLSASCWSPLAEARPEYSCRNLLQIQNLMKKKFPFNGNAAVLRNVVPDIHRRARQSILQLTALLECETSSVVGAQHSMSSV